MLRSIDHVGHAVRDLDAAVAHYRLVLGAELVHTETMERDGVREALLAVGGGYVQLLEATRPDSPVARFIERNGEGVHHIGYRVDDVAAALEQARAAGARLVDEEPRPGSRGTTVAFLHPKGMHGVLVELVEDPRAS